MSSSVISQRSKDLRQLLRAGIQKVRVILRALALEQLSRGLTAPAVARIVHLVVCLDEKPISLHTDLRPATPATPGRMAKRDND
jgi:hypothetical protein